MRLLSLFLAFTFATPALAAAFPDTGNSPFQVEIQELKDRGMVQGYPDGTFKPDWTLNRAEFLKMLAGFVPGEDRPLGSRKCFADFTGDEQWFWIYACSAKERGVITGYPNGTFGGINKINAAEALKMSLSAFKVTLPVYIREPDHWYDPYFDAASGLKLFDRLPRDPQHLITRGEMAFILVTLDRDRKAREPQ